MPAPDDTTLVASRITLIHTTTVEGALYGLALVLYIFCTRSLFLQLKDRERCRQNLFTLLYMSLIMTLTFTGIAVDAQNAQFSYVNNADYPGGGFSYSSNVFGVLPPAIVGYVASAFSSLMMSGIQIWRLWVVWRASQYFIWILVFPALSFLASLGMEVAAVVQATSPVTNVKFDELVLYGKVIFPLCISATATVLITGRIFVARRKNAEIMGHNDTPSPLTSVISILIESFALESIWMVIQLGLLIAHYLLFRDWDIIAADMFFVDILPFIRLFAYLLIIYRVVMGRGWKEDTAEKLTSLQWNRDGLQPTQTSTQASILIIHEEA